MGRPTISPQGRVIALSVRLTPEAYAALKRVQKRWGVGPSEAVRRMAIKEDKRK